MEYKILEELKDIKSILLDNTSGKYLDMRKMLKYTSLGESTIRRAVKRGELICSNTTGKLLFNINDVDRWLNG